jgi:uncharacterized protein YxjI
MSQSEQEEPRDEYQVDNTPGQVGTKTYQLRQELVSVGKDYWIENEQGEQVYRIDGKALTVRKTFYFEDTHGNKLAKIHKIMLTLKEKMVIEAPDGRRLAVVKKDLFTPLKEHFVVKIENGPDLEINGNLVDHEYTIKNDIQKIAQVSKKWLTVRDNYAVTIDPGQDDVVILSVVLCIDAMSHATR